MKRINLEFSANLARLIRMLHLAHHHFAVSRLRLRQCTEILDAFRGLTSPDFWNLAGPDLRARMERTRPILVQHPYRVLANSMVISAYRNGPVENLHRGRSTGYTLIHRRATDRQSRELMLFTSEQLASALSSLRPWKLCVDPPIPWPENLAGIYISPCFGARTWSLTESCSRIDLKSPADYRPADS